MSEKAKHSPPPWSLGQNGRCMDRIMDANGNDVCAVEYEYDMPVKTRKANRDAIFRAVNAHAALMEALRGVMGVLATADPQHGDDILYYFDGLRADIEAIINPALTIAEAGVVRRPRSNQNACSLKGTR